MRKADRQSGKYSGGENGPSPLGFLPPLLRLPVPHASLCTVTCFTGARRPRLHRLEKRAATNGSLALKKLFPCRIDKFCLMLRAAGRVRGSADRQGEPMLIAQIAPLTEAIPPKLYGGTERVVYWLVEEL